MEYYYISIINPFDFTDKRIVEMESSMKPFNQWLSMSIFFPIRLYSISMLVYVCVPNHYYHEAPSLKAPLNFFFFPTSKRSWHQENELQKGVFSILHVGWLHETLWKWWWSPWGWPLFSLRDKKRRSPLDSCSRSGIKMSCCCCWLIFQILATDY